VPRDLRADKLKVMDVNAWLEDDPVRVYLAEVSNVPPLSATEEAACIEHVRRQDQLAESAEACLVETHLELVVSIAQRYPRDRMHIMDLIQTGNMALLSAVEAVKKGAAGHFADIASEHIEQAVRRAAVSG